MAKTTKPSGGNSGRLELTWTNKDEALLSHEDGSYEWVGRHDRRVAEVRLLRDVETVTAEGENSAPSNLLIRGDALHALTSLAKLSDYKKEYAGKVKLAYIDPPFNTGQMFEHYDDNLEHSVWLTMMRDRLEQIQELLAPEGSVWVHCDDAEQHRLRCVMDEVFGPNMFKATIVWQKLYARKSNTDFSGSHDFIHVYANNAEHFQRNLQRASEEQLARYQNPDNDSRGVWQSVSFSVRTDNPDKRTEYRYDITLPSGRVVQPPDGRHWNGKRPRYEQLKSEKRLHFGSDGDSLPRLKDFLKPDEIGLVPITWWPRTEVGDNDEAKGEIKTLFPLIKDPFQTPKPERLMERIIHIASNPGDIVLDCFLGSGSTTAVAHKMGRRWVGVEWSADTLKTFTSVRMRKIVRGEDPGGISKQVGWAGGGGFQVLDVAPSMYVEDDGIVMIANWAVGGELAEAVAAQFGYAYDPEPPFSGKKGRTRLAVVDGHADEHLAEALVHRLGDDERLHLCATSIAPDTGDALRGLRLGSKISLIPQDVLLAYEGARWRLKTKAAPATKSATTGDGNSITKAGKQTKVKSGDSKDTAPSAPGKSGSKSRAKSAARTNARGNK